jgi:hypothetical protein
MVGVRTQGRYQVERLLDWLMAGSGFEMVRYADDMVVLCRSREEAVEALLRSKPLTREPDAGDPPVWFGGRGGANQYPIPTSFR